MRITIAPAGGEEFELYQGPPTDLPDALHETIATRCMQKVLKVEDGILKVDARKGTARVDLLRMECTTPQKNRIRILVEDYELSVVNPGWEGDALNFVSQHVATTHVIENETSMNEGL